MSLRFCALLAFVILGSLTGIQVQPVSAANSKRLLAYYPYWNDNYRAAQIPFTKLTHIAHAFLTPNTDGSLTAPDGYLEPALLTLAHAAGVKVVASVGGASDSAN